MPHPRPGAARAATSTALEARAGGATTPSRPRSRAASVAAALAAAAARVGALLGYTAFPTKCPFCGDLLAAEADAAAEAAEAVRASGAGPAEGAGPAARDVRGARGASAETGAGAPSSAGAVAGRSAPLVCAPCLEGVRARGPRCRRCDASIARRADDPAARARCRHCRDLAAATPRVVVVGAYERDLGRAVQALKFEGRPAVARALGALLAERVVRRGIRADVVVPVPGDPGRDRARGFAHAALLADEVAQSLGLPLRAGALRRLRAVPPLRTLDRAERRAAVLGAFGAEAGAVAGARVLIVDDVLTTGATLAAAARALRDAGARAVVGACVARRHRLGEPG